MDSRPPSSRGQALRGNNGENTEMTGVGVGGVWDDNGWGRGRSGRGAIATGARR